jgi:hypothetical protein
MIADCLLLDAESARYLGKLEVGWGVVRLQGRWFDPFLVKFPLIRLEKGKVTDKAISERMRPYRARSELVSPSAGCSCPSEAQMQPAAAARISGKEDENTRTTSGAIGLTTEERTFLEDVLTHKASTIRERYSRLSLNAYRGNLLQHSLLSKGLVSSQDISTGKSRVKVLCLTNEGRRALGQHAETPQRTGSPEHEYWRAKVAERFRAKGYTVSEEFPLGAGKTVDLVAENDKERIAIEIETGKSDALGNIRKCLAAGFDRVLCFALSEDVRRSVLLSPEARDPHVQLKTP